MNDCITTIKQSTTKPRAYFLGYTVCFVGCNYVLIPTLAIPIAIAGLAILCQ